MYVKTNNEKVTDNLLVNLKIAEDQPQYETLPCHRTPEGVVLVAFDLTEDDIEKIKKHKKIYYLQQVGNTRSYNVELSEEKIKYMWESGDACTIKVVAKSQLQPINIALTPQDIEEAAGYSKEMLLPVAGDADA